MKLSASVCIFSLLASTSAFAMCQDGMPPMRNSCGQLTCSRDDSGCPSSPSGSSGKTLTNVSALNPALHAGALKLAPPALKCPQGTIADLIHHSCVRPMVSQKISAGALSGPSGGPVMKSGHR